MLWDMMMGSLEDRYSPYEDESRHDVEERIVLGTIKQVGAVFGIWLGFATICYAISLAYALTAMGGR